MFSFHGGKVRTCSRPLLFLIDDVANDVANDVAQKQWESNWFSTGSMKLEPSLEEHRRPKTVSVLGLQSY